MEHATIGAAFGFDAISFEDRRPEDWHYGPSRVRSVVARNTIVQTWLVYDIVFLLLQCEQPQLLNGNA